MKVHHDKVYYMTSKGYSQRDTIIILLKLLGFPTKGSLKILNLTKKNQY